jgi:putative hemolysin
MANKIAAFILVALISALLIGCGSAPQKYMLSKEEAQKEKAVQKTELANPASMHCMNESGNSWQTREDASGGQYGVCIFSDGSWCEEWAYYRGQCERGTNMTSCEGQFVTKSVCPPEYNPVCARVRIGDNVTFREMDRGYNNACKACTSDEEGEEVLGYVVGACDDRGI